MSLEKKAMSFLLTIFRFKKLLRQPSNNAKKAVKYVFEAQNKGLSLIVIFVTFP